MAGGVVYRPVRVLPGEAVGLHGVFQPVRIWPPVAVDGERVQELQPPQLALQPRFAQEVIKETEVELRVVGREQRPRAR